MKVTLSALLKSETRSTLNPTLHSLLLLFIAAGCAAAAVETPLPPGIDNHEANEPSKEMVVSSQPAPGRDAIALARANLAQRLGIAVDTITVGLQESVQWRNGSAGCPQPGMQYIQTLLSGYRIRLDHAGNSYWYHGRGSGKPFYCQHPQAPVGKGSG